MRYYLPGEDPTHPEARHAYKILKSFGYRGFGRTAAMRRGYDRTFTAGVEHPFCCDGHRLYINRYDGKWEINSHKEAGIEHSIGSGAYELARALNQIDLKIKALVKQRAEMGAKTL